MMKLVAVSALFYAASPLATSAFSPSARSTSCRTTSASASTSSSSLNLFGSKAKDDKAPAAGGPMGGGGMMDQLAMFKKAQELSSKKSQLDKELAAEPIVGTAADGNIKATCKYIPPQLPASPTPGFETASIEIDEAYLEGVDVEVLSEALVEAIRDAERRASEAVQNKYKALEEDMKAMMGGGMLGGGGAAPVENELPAE